MKGFSDKKKNFNNQVKSTPDMEKEINQLKTQALNYQNKGELEKATRLYEILVDKKVKDYRVYLNYGILCQFQKNFKRSILMFKKSIKFHPDNQLAYFKIGFILNNTGRHKEALDYSIKSLNLKPKVWQSYILVIQIFENLNKVREAIDTANKANQIIPNNHLILANLGRLYGSLVEHKKAEEFYIKSISSNSTDPATLYGYAIQLLSIGEKDKGSKVLKKIIDISPTYTMAYFTLSRLVDTKKEPIYVNKILNFDENFFKDNINRYNLLFAKSYIYHRVKNFEKSELYLKKANVLKLIDKPNNSSKILKLSREIFESQEGRRYKPNKNCSEITNIFIVGLPRSGSTLVESVLGTNKKVSNLGENSIFFNSFNESNPFNLDKLSDIYSSKIRNLIKNKISTNKTLINYIYTPYILNNIHNSRIIFTFRNPLDNILSMYRAKFTGSGNEYSSCIISSAKVLLNHWIILQKYKEIFNDEIYFLNYDKLVQKPNIEIKKLIEWLNWEWDERYLNPETNEQAFYTASIVEVRSAINSKSLGGWKNYENLLKPAQEFFKENLEEIPTFFKNQFQI